MGAESRPIAGEPGTRAVLLDALGTLLRLEPPAPRLREALRRRGVEVEPDQAERAIRAEVAYYRAHLHEGRDAESLARLRAACATEMAAHLPPVDDPLGALLESLEFTPFEEVPRVLAALRERGARLVVVSNWDFSLHEVRSRTGLLELVDGAVCSAEVGAAKPDPAIFEAGLALAGAAAGEAVHVGDTPEADVDGARAAGIRAVLLRRELGDSLELLL
jgi:putative hydrolase of the HAD superfamily